VTKAAQAELSNGRVDDPAVRGQSLIISRGNREHRGIFRGETLPRVKEGIRLWPRPPHRCVFKGAAYQGLSLALFPAQPEPCLSLPPPSIYDPQKVSNLSRRVDGCKPLPRIASLSASALDATSSADDPLTVPFAIRSASPLVAAAQVEIESADCKRFFTF